ncbi:free fatty acid receptor 4-like [Anthonomus grandis grandis]|uniref:free fatty acid receptor 4-like n=1 Tax=Anthonomus grandis grandis TaxID=2921223 RepID=UPI00216510C5|nr:free fatty acid receptor 4-like [Anthonomus grandis grandis]
MGYEVAISTDFTWNTSYVFGYDNESGWGGRYFFTYFSEFKRPENNYYCVVELVVLGLIFIVSLFANVSIIICVSRYPEMKTVTNCFVLNLAVSDLIFAFTIPVVAYTRISQSWEFGDLTCRILPYVQFVSGIVLLWTLAFISIDRHRCIVVPPYRSKMTPEQANCTSALIWFATSIAVIPVALWFREIKGDNDLTICSLVFPHTDSVHVSIVFIVVVVVFACLLPMGLLVYHYQQIFQKILSTKNAWSTSCVVISAVEIKGCNRAQTRRQSEISLSDIFVPWPRKFSTQLSNSNGSRHGSLSTQEELRLNKHIKVVRVLFLNVVVVLVMWLPITLVMVLIHIDGRRENADHNYFLRSHHFIAAVCVALLNTVVNPLLYGVLSENFRACLLKIWCRQDAIVLDPATPSSGKQHCCKTKRPSASLSERSEKSDRFDIDRKLGVGLL